MLLYNLFLFLITLAGGSAPLWMKGLNDRKTNYLLAFSGSFLLSITLLHLLPETFKDLGDKAGIFVLTGFFVQLLIQRLTHGIEHGHTHIHVENHGHNHSAQLTSIIAGLSLHAFMEGLPLGFNYRMPGTEYSLFLAVAAHKLPEVMLLVSLIYSLKGRSQAIFALFFFSLITPVASLLAAFLGEKYMAMSEVVMWIIPVVAGAFIHIATTIFFESGTKQHMLTRQKTLAILIGVGLGLLTLLFE